MRRIRASKYYSKVTVEPSVTIAGLSFPRLAFLTGMVPLLVVNVSYLISAAGGHLPWCIPYLEGCTSISAAGRHGLAYIFFKAGMLPAAALLAAYWITAERWLSAIGDTASREGGAMVVIGCISAIFLVLYTIFLGSQGDFFQLMRRFGVTVYFSFSVLAQMLMVSRLNKLARKKTLALPQWIPAAKLTLLIALLVLGIGSIPISNFVADKDVPERIVEWNFALLMTSFYFLSWRAMLIPFPAARKRSGLPGPGAF